MEWATRGKAGIHGGRGQAYTRGGDWGSGGSRRSTSDSPGRRGLQGQLGAVEAQERQRERRTPRLREALVRALAQHGVGGSGQRGEWPGSAGGGARPQQ